MKDDTARTGRTRGYRKKLVGALSAQKLLLYAPLLRWYVAHGAVITAVHHLIIYQKTEIFPWFVEQVTEACWTRDADKSKALLAEVFKLLSNSAYGELIKVLEQQIRVMYTRMRRWWTGPCKARFSAIWMRSREPMSWKAGRLMSISLACSRSISRCISLPS